jgi:hypothetical protein
MHVHRSTSSNSGGKGLLDASHSFSVVLGTSHSLLAHVSFITRHTNDTNTTQHNTTQHNTTQHNTTETHDTRHTAHMRVAPLLGTTIRAEQNIAKVAPDQALRWTQAVVRQEKSKQGWA